jgi:hypothetical protein
MLTACDGGEKSPIESHFENNIKLQKKYWIAYGPLR